MNVMKTGILLAGLTGLFLAVGYVIGGQSGMVMAFLFSVGMNLFAYWNSDRMVLRMHNAEPVDERSAPELYAMVRELAGRAGIPVPKVFLMHEDQPNAFATGRNPENAAVAVTTGLLQRLGGDEVAGVVAHELAHIKHRDTLTMTITATLAGAISMLGNFAFFFGGRSRDNPLGAVGTIAMVILAPLAAMLVQMAISRTREYAADRRGAEISGQPLSLASALEKIANAAHHIENRSAEANPATAHMFIINPLSGHGMDNLFSTHPNPENRIAALEQMAEEFGQMQRTSSSVFEQDGTASSGPWTPRARSSRGPWG